MDLEESRRTESGRRRKEPPADLAVDLDESRGTGSTGSSSSEPEEPARRSPEELVDELAVDRPELMDEGLRLESESSPEDCDRL